MSFGTVWKSSSYNYSNKKLTRLQYRKDIKNNIFGLTCSFCTLQGCKFYPRMGYLEPQSRACEARRRNNSRRNEREPRKKGNTKSVKNAVAPGATKGTGSSSSSSSSKLETTNGFSFGCLLVWLFILVDSLFLCSSASLGMTPERIPSPRTVKSFFMVPWNLPSEEPRAGRAGWNETGSDTVNRESVRPFQKCRKCPSRCRTRERETKGVELKPTSHVSTGRRVRSRRRVKLTGRAYPAFGSRAQFWCADSLPGRLRDISRDSQSSVLFNFLLCHFKEKCWCLL